MSKIGNTLRMLLELSKRGKMKISTLADIIEVNPRQIRRYRDDLEQAGIYIKSTTGKYGGYELEDSDLNINLDAKITNHDQLIIELLSKEVGVPINLLFDNLKYYLSNHLIDELNEDKGSVDEINKLLIIQSAIKNKKILRLNYAKPNGEVVKLDIHPYFTYKKNGIHYISCLVDLTKHFISVRLKRIIKIVQYDENFEFDKKTYDKEFAKVNDLDGIYQGDVHTVKLKLNKSIIEKFKSFIDVTHTVEGNVVIFKTQSINETKRKIMYFGKNIKVIEPQELIDSIKKEIKDVKDVYEK